MHPNQAKHNRTHEAKLKKEGKIVVRCTVPRANNGRARILAAAAEMCREHEIAMTDDRHCRYCKR